MRIVFVAIAFFAALAAAPQPAACMWCDTLPCYGPCNGSDCVCLVPPGSVGPGHCYGIERRSAMLASGYQEVQQ